MFKVAIGHSDDIDTTDAINEVLKQCKKTVGDIKPQAGLLFCGIDYEFDKVIDITNKEYPDIELIGATSEAEVSSQRGFLEDSVNLTLFYSDEVKIRAGLGKNVSKNTEKATREAVDQAKQKLGVKPKFCIITPESLKTSQVSILKGLQDQLGENFPIVGGAAGGNYELKENYQFYKNKILTDSVPILLFSDPIKYSFGIASGCSPLGQAKRVTKVKNNVLYMLDDMTALDFYKHYLGDHDITTADHPLAIFEEDEKHFSTRVPFYCNEEDKSITFSGDIPEGAIVRLSDMSTDSMIEAINSAYQQTMDNYDGKEPALVAIFSCAIRKHLLGTRVGIEYDIVNKLSKPGLPVCGFYTYGEISPFEKNTGSRIHNSTIVTLMIGT